MQCKARHTTPLSIIITKTPFYFALQICNEPTKKSALSRDACVAKSAANLNLERKQDEELDFLGWMLCVPEPNFCCLLIKVSGLLLITMMKI